MSALCQPLRESDARALAALFQKTATEPNKPILPLSATEGAQWVDVLQATRTGFLKFGSYGRASALVIAGRALQRFAAEPAPAMWSDVLRPTHDLFTAGLADGSLEVRVAALTEIARLWHWMPGRLFELKEEDVLADWKRGLHAPVVRRLADREPKARAAAIACLGLLPIDSAAAPALAYLEDPSSPEVRKQVLVSFAGRPALLTEDALLRHMYDKDPGIPPLAETILRTRGLTQEQVSLGSMIFHPKPEIRASVIALVKDRTDIDPVVWLLQLSRDAEETVRIGSIEALAKRMSPEVGQRIAEMATTDKSAEVRRAASKYLPEIEKTVSLPPLPGSPSLSPKAN
jgi:hypothetical protein